MKKVVVTGAANGIGRATVRACIDAGYFVIAVDKDRAGLQRLFDDTDAQDAIEIQPADLADDGHIASLIPGLYQRHDTLHGLVNNAGIYHGKGVERYSDQEIDEIWRVNLKSLVCLSRDFALGGEHQRTKGAKETRCIVNVASVAGEVGSMDALYGATKAGVIGLTKANAWNFGPRVRVNAVSPALIRETAIHDRIPEHRRIEYERQEVLEEPILPNGVAAVILFLLSDQSRHMTGKVLAVDNGAYPR